MIVLNSFLDFGPEYPGFWPEYPGLPEMFLDRGQILRPTGQILRGPVFLYWNWTRYSGLKTGVSGVVLYIRSLRGKRPEYPG